MEYQELQGSIDEELCNPRRGLQRKLELLKAEKLKRLRTLQAYNDRPRYEHEIYSRVKFMVPEWCRLEKNLFEFVPLRSHIGMQVIQDLYALYICDKEVAFRPGLEPALCSCPRKNGSYDWRHVYNCCKAKFTANHSYSEFCFLCNMWIHGKITWEEHCQEHIDDMEKFPVWVDPLVFQNVLAVAGFCEFCLVNPRLPASMRMQQFTWRHRWLDHYQAHYQDTNFEPKCRHRSWESLQELQFHLHDRHGVELPDTSRQCKRRKRDQEKPEQPKQTSPKRRKRRRDQDRSADVSFHNNTIDSVALSLRSAELSLVDTDFNKAQLLHPKSDYPDADTAKSSLDPGPYFHINATPESEQSDTKYTYINDILVDSASEPELNSNAKKIDEQEQTGIIDLTGIGEMQEAKPRITG